MSKLLFILAFVLSIHACYAMEGTSAKKKRHHGPTKVEEPKPIVSPNGPAPEGGY